MSRSSVFADGGFSRQVWLSDRPPAAQGRACGQRLGCAGWKRGGGGRGGRGRGLRRVVDRHGVSLTVVSGVRGHRLAEVSKSTFFRFFPAKEAAAIEAEAELWTAYLAALAGRDLSGPVLAELHQTLTAAAAGLDPGWDERFVATRRLIATETALLRYVEHYRAGIKGQVVACLADKLQLDAEDLRLPVLAELATTAFSLSGRHWVHHGGHGGRKALLQGFDRAIKAIPASLDLAAPPKPAQDDGT
jgi:AcrR family transcriptional regulator